MKITLGKIRKLIKEAIELQPGDEGYDDWMEETSQAGIDRAAEGVYPILDQLVEPLGLNDVNDFERDHGDGSIDFSVTTSLDAVKVISAEFGPPTDSFKTGVTRWQLSPKVAIHVEPAGDKVRWGGDVAPHDTVIVMGDDEDISGGYGY